MYLLFFDREDLGGVKLVAGFSKTQERLEVEEFLCRDRFQLQVMPQTKQPISTLTEVCLVFVSNKKLLNMFFFRVCSSVIHGIWMYLIFVWP